MNLYPKKVLDFLVYNYLGSQRFKELTGKVFLAKMSLFSFGIGFYEVDYAAK